MYRGGDLVRWSPTEATPLGGWATEPEAWKLHIRPAVANDETMAIVERGVASGAFELWEGDDCAGVCQRVKTFDVWFAGGKLAGLKKLLKQAEADAAADGCDRVMFSGRKEWARALDGYRVVTVLVKDLK